MIRNERIEPNNTQQCRWQRHRHRMNVLIQMIDMLVKIDINRLKLIDIFDPITIGNVDREFRASQMCEI